MSGRAHAEVLELFAGPGGWSEGLRLLGVHGALGIEMDAAACKTAEAAGHRRLLADVTALDPYRFAPVIGLIASPPCKPFSPAGKRRGVLDQPQILRILQAVHDAAKDSGADGAHRALTDYLEGETGQWHDDDSRLVLEPVRYALALLPEWITCEQVPDVLPFWHRIAALLRTLGYSASAGLLSAERYGVAQTRKRAILAASRTRQVSLPPATHLAYDRDATDEPGLFEVPLLPCVSMAQALGWGDLGRPTHTVTAGGTGSGGGVEVFNQTARDSQARARAREVHGCRAFRLHRGAGMTDRHGDRPDTPVTEPAPVITSKARSARWVLGGVSS